MKRGFFAFKDLTRMTLAAVHVFCYADKLPLVTKLYQSRWNSVNFVTCRKSVRAPVAENDRASTSAAAGTVESSS